MAKSKKKSGGSVIPLSGEAYIKSGKARNLNLFQCWINDDWKETGLAHIIVSREHVNFNITAGIYLADLLCAGVKDTF